MPVTSITFVVATAAIAGVPGLSGFFSKDEILASVFAHGNWGLWVVAVAGAALTAFYMTRLTVLVFAGSGRSGSGEGKRIHESPPSMTVPLALLAAGAAAAGLMGVPEVLGGHNRFAHFLAPVVGHHSLGLGHGLELSLMAVSVAAASAGILAAWLLYRRGPEADRVLSARAPRAYRSAASAYYVDRAYERGVALPALGLGERLWKGIDGGVIDTLVDATAALAAELSEMWRRMTTGNFQHYALILFVAAAAMALALVSGVGN
jgi:NADH-quinone oxidoreductase subunit L